jgi:2-keto-4-pentenoate hydratase
MAESPTANVPVSDIEFAASRLAGARKTRSQIERLPETARPQTADEAIAIQRRAFELSGEKCGGWKCSVPVGDRMIVAPLPASTIYRSSPVPIIPKGSIALIEPEIAFILKRDYSRAWPRTAKRKCAIPSQKRIWFWNSWEVATRTMIP